MPKYGCRFLIPLAYNDGQLIEPAKFMEIKRRLDAEFGAYRIITEESEGSWQGQVENVMEIEVAVFKKRIPSLKKAVIEIGRDLGQLAMYFKTPPQPDVEILDTVTGEEWEEDDGEDEEGGNEVEQ
jgi:hypothetical protein